ncbi:MAG TPA: hypothetical protein VIV34_12735 [Pseudolabrys sp.]
MSMLDKDPMQNLPMVTQPQSGKKRAAGWQVTLTAIGAIAIVTIFLWGINNQRDETSGQHTAATQPTPASPQGANQQSGQQSPQGQDQQQAGQQQGSGSTKSSDTTGSGSASPQPLTAAPAKSGSQ